MDVKESTNIEYLYFTEGYVFNMKGIVLLNQ